MRGSIGLDARLRHLLGGDGGDLLTLFKLDQELAGGSSSDASKPLRTRVAARFFLEAVEYGRLALAAEPGHPGAQAIVTEARQLSGDLYLRAYQLRDSDQPEALRLFKEVLAMTPPDDPNHVKARGYIERFEAR